MVCYVLKRILYKSRFYKMHIISELWLCGLAVIYNSTKIWCRWCT